MHSELPPMGGGAKVVYEDEHVVVVDKPPGLITATPNDSPTDSADTLMFHVRQYVRSRHHRGPRGKGPSAWVVHTLDRHVSGLVVFARSQPACLALKNQVKAHRVHRRYVALVEGELPTTPAGKWVSPADLEVEVAPPLAPPVVAPPAMRVGPGLVKPLMAPAPGGPGQDAPANRRMRRDALADASPPTCHVLAAGSGRSLVEVRMEAPGRLSVRSQLARAGHPIVEGSDLPAPVAAGEGEPPAAPAPSEGQAPEPVSAGVIEGEPGPVPVSEAATPPVPPAPHRRLALHAFELSFVHPVTGKPVRFTCPPPEEFLQPVGATPAVLGVRPKAAAAEEERRGDAETRGRGEPEAPAKPARVAEKRSVPESPGPTPPLPPRPAVSESPRPPASSRGRDSAVASRVPASPRPASSAAAAGWDHVAAWYEGLLAEGGSDYHQELILPGIRRLLDPQPGQRVLDVACGEGLLCRQLAAMGVLCVGVDASERLVGSAVRQAEALPQAVRPAFLTGDARHLPDVPDLVAGMFDAATCVLALMNMDPIEPVLAGVSELLKPGGRLAAVILHPAFRAPGQTSWQWEGPRRPDHGKAPAAPKGKPPGRPVPPPPPLKANRQYRRVDAYLSVASRSIVMNPGQVSSGEPAVTTVTWHRPIQAYVSAFAAAGLLVDALEEWPSHRQSEPGPRAAEEDRARREIPMFLAIRGRRG
jgi:SAM-dependent methyltransferase